MTTRGSRTIQHLTRLMMLSACYSLWPAGATAEASLTAVEVLFDVERNDAAVKATPILDALDPPTLDELIGEFQAEAVTYCAQRFPYLEWVGVSASAAQEPGLARLRIFMKAENPNGKVYLECVPAIEKEDQGKATAIVYDNEETQPDRYYESQDTIRVEVLKRTRKALTNLISDASRLGNIIPMTDTIYVDANDHLLILPTEAGEFCAGRGSTLWVRFVSTWPDNRPRPAHIDMEIFDEVLDPNHTCYGMQTCTVSQFRCPQYPGESGWHDVIPTLLDHKAENSLRVYMYQYVEEGIGNWVSHP